MLPYPMMSFISLLSVFHEVFLFSRNPTGDDVKQPLHTEILCCSHDLPQVTAILNLPGHPKIYNFYITKRIDTAQQNILRLE